jgi:transmembrane sensor
VDERRWELLVRLLSGEASPVEREEMERWTAADPAHAREVESLRALWNASGALPRRGDPAAAWQKVAARTALAGATAVTGAGPVRDELATRRARRAPTWNGPLLRIAAALVLLLGGALLWRPAVGLATQRTVVTGKGERVQLTLSDGTRVLLGVDSRLRYPRRFGGGARDVRLEGVAYFEVARDPARPFSVHTPDAVTRVLGTKFTVRDYPGAEPARVAVTEGRVAVRPTRAPAGATAPAAILVRGQAAELPSPSTPAVVEPADVGHELAWTRGTIDFRNAPVTQVVAEIGRWYDVEIQVPDSALAGRHLTISFDDEPLETLLREIAAALNARVERQGRTLILVPASAARPGPTGQEASRRHSL